MKLSAKIASNKKAATLLLLTIIYWMNKKMNESDEVCRYIEDMK